MRLASTDMRLSGLRTNLPGLLVSKWNHSTTRFFVSIVFGAIAFLVSVGPQVLNIRNTRWLLVGDTATYYLTWEFFRKTPVFQWPLGANPNFGVGFDSSIVFSDSIPLVALIMKPLGKLLSGDLQYFGWWILLCFILQAFFALKVLSLLNVTFVVQLAVLPLFLLQPSLLDRLSFDGYGHLALSAHWLILAAFSLFLALRTTHLHWLLLVVLSIGINFYLFVIVGIFMLSWALVRVYKSSRRAHTLISEVIWGMAAVALSLVFLLVLDGLNSRSFSDSGLGLYRTTLLSLIDSGTPTGQTWSQILTFLQLSTPKGGQEGFGFIGAGVVVFVLVAVAFSLRNPRMQALVPLVPLGIVAGFFFILALSPRVAVTERELFTYPLPPLIEQMIGVVRATGRFIWVPMYFLMVGAIVVVAVRLKGKPKVLLALSLCAVLFQLVDSRVAITETRSRFTDTKPMLITDDPFWDEIAKGRSHLVSIPPLNNDPRWIDLAVFALRNDMSTNAAYLSRKDELNFQALVASTQQLLERREFEDDTVYVLTNYPPNPETQKLFAEQNAGTLTNFRVVQIEELTVVYAVTPG